MSLRRCFPDPAMRFFGRAVHEPDRMAGNGVTCHLPRVHNVVKDNEIRSGVIIIKAEVGAHPPRVILYRTINIELDIVRIRIKVAVDDTVIRGIRAIELIGLYRGGCR